MSNIIAVIWHGQDIIIIIYMKHEDRSLTIYNICATLL